jgi:hypothetical protein
MQENLTLLGTLLTGMTAMGGAVGMLWRHVEKLHSETMARMDKTTDRIEHELKDCQADRVKLWEHITKTQENNQ